MKRILILSLFATFVISLSGQSAIDRLFEKYQGSDGFTVITINGNMLRLIADIDEDEDELMKHADKFTTIRILAQDDDTDLDVNFYDLVMRDLDRDGYEEMVSINSSDSDVKILVKAEGKVFKEFLLVAGGDDDNAIIQIKGNMTYEDVKQMSESVKDDHDIGFLHL